MVDHIQIIQGEQNTDGTSLLIQSKLSSVSNTTANAAQTAAQTAYRVCL